jgi:Type IV secretion system pilin
MKILRALIGLIIALAPSLFFVEVGFTATGDIGNPNSPNFVWPPAPPTTSTPTGTSAPASGSCNFDPNDNQGPGAISAALKGCKPKGMIETKGDYVIESGVRSRIVDIANNLILIGSILSVGAIVYAALLYTIAAWDDERIKTAKNALKFGIIGFAVMLLSFGAVNAIVRLFYATSGG